MVVKLKRLRSIIIMMCMCLFLSSCTSLFIKKGQSQIIDRQTFIDDVGETFTIEKPYTKIVTLYSAHTENLFELGVGDSIIGVNTTSIYPPKAAFLPMYDYRDDPEPLIAADPDLVIIRPFINRNYPDYVGALKKAGLTVISLYPESNDEFEKYITILSMITGTQETAKEKLTELDARVKAIEEKTKAITKKETVFFESTKTNYRTVTIDSNPARAIISAGGINIASNVKPMEKGSTIAEYGIEKLMMNADKIDVYISQRGAMNSGGSILSIPQREGFHAIKAVQEMRILELNEKIISAPTFRYDKGVLEIARMLYPKLMDDYSPYVTDEPLTRETYAIMTVMFDHSPIFIPSSSHYYETDYYNHTYGLFEDVAWNDETFDFIETSVLNSFIKGYEKEDGTEYFDKEGVVTRKNLAFTLYIMRDFQTTEKHISINDIDGVEDRKIIQKIVDNGMMFVDHQGNFNPNQPVTGQEAIEILERLNTLE